MSLTDNMGHAPGCPVWPLCYCYDPISRTHAPEVIMETIPAAHTSFVPGQAPANPKQAFGDKKIPLHLVPPALMIGAARAFREGAAKYGPYNWRQSKVELLTYIGAIQRHLAAILDGEDVDPESSTGKYHLDGIAASVAIALDALHGGFLIDNRPQPGPAPALLRTPK